MRSDQKRFRKYFLPSTKPFLTVYPQVILILNGFMLLCMIMLSLIIELTLILFNDVLRKLKPHKDGKYGFKSDNLINGSNKLFIMLSIMFNAMLTHGFNPEDLLLSTIISIPKDNRGSMNSSDNYRGISLSNSICKLYDYVFIDLNMDYLKTDDMQFGFKDNHSTVLCTAVYIETINHYMNEGSDVYSCLIDASKAFDSPLGETFFCPN